ncbi:MAG TPA: copper-binding protein [Candidatus Saccharimonadales bacterium]|nr:copper-binding protein [Candidatus Saccharimonadales bacterium]
MFPWILALAAGLLLSTGCGKSGSAHVAHNDTGNRISSLDLPNETNAWQTMLGSPTVSTGVMRSFSARGLIRELPTEGKTVVVRHDEIPGYMATMTMEFTVRDTNELRGLKVGDGITFQVKANEEESWIEGIRRAGTNDFTPIPVTGPSMTSLLHAGQLKPGDMLPDAELLAEDGRTVKLSEFEGRALAFTFIFTRCPLPDYCPRMNQHFSRAREFLQQGQGGPTNWQFLSVSFDPDFDKPGVLKRYAYSYRGKDADRWLFAASPTNLTAAMGPLVDFRFANEGGSFLHNLRTVVLDPQRRVYRQFDGSKWKAEELARSMSEAAQLKKSVE